MKTELVLGSLFNFLWFFRLAYFLYLTGMYSSMLIIDGEVEVVIVMFYLSAGELIQMSQVKYCSGRDDKP